MQERGFSSLEGRLKEAMFCDWQGDARGVWERYVQIKEGKEAYMSKSPFRLVLIGALVGLLVVGGFWGMGWFFEYQKAQKLNQGEAILVTMTVGDVQIRKMGSDVWRPVAVEDVVEMGDTLRTGSDSACELQIVERGVYRLEANTEMLVAKLVNQDGDTLTAKMHIDKGTMGLKPRKLKKGEVFEVETSTAVAAVRGTVFMVSVTEEGDTKVAVTEGKVALTPKIESLEKARQEAKIDEKAYEALQQSVAAPIEVEANEEVALRSEVVKKVDEKVAKVIDQKATTEGPITADKVETVKQEVIQEVVKGVAGETTSVPEASSVVAVVAQKSEITEESKKILEKVQNKTPLTKRRVRVSFNSDVPGAIVSVNGEVWGKTPLSRVLDEEATYTVVFEKEGYERLSQEVKLSATTNIVVKLSPVQVATNEVALQTPAETKVTPVSKTNEPSAAPLPKPGDMVWEKPFKEVVSPAMTVVMRGRPSEDRIVSAVENRIVIMNLDGEVEKSFVLGKGTTYDFPMVATPKGIFARDDDGMIYCYDFTGTQKWSVKLTKSPAWTGFSIGKDTLLIPVVQNRIYMLSMATGEILLTVEAAGQIYAPPVMVDAKLLVYAQENGVVVGYDTGHKTALWQKDMGKRSVLPLYGFDAREKKVAVVPLQGSLVGIDALTGDVLWEKDMTIDGTVKPLAVGSVLYVVRKNVLTGIDMFSGSVMTRIETAGNILSLQVDRRGIYILDGTGRLTAFTPRGKQLWSYQAPRSAQSLAVHPEGVYVFTKTSVAKLVNEVPKAK